MKTNKKEIVQKICGLAFLSPKATYGLMDLRKNDLEKLSSALESIHQLDKIALQKLHRIKYSRDLCKDCENANDPTKPGWKFEDGLCKVWKLGSAKKEAFIYDPVIECDGFKKRR